MKMPEAIVSAIDKGTPLSKKLLNASYGLTVVSVLFFIFVIAFEHIGFFSAAYFSILSIGWQLALFFKSRTLKTPAEPRFYNHSFVFAIVTGLCSLISTGSFLAARAYDKIGALFALTNSFYPILFLYLHYLQSRRPYQDFDSVKTGLSFFREFGLGIFGLLFMLLHISSCNQAIALASENAAYGQLPGQQFNLPNTKVNLHVYCVGEKKNPTDPIVWFEHGLGGSYLDFTWVQTNVSTYAKTCAIDHGGLGWSSIPRYQRGTEKIVEELKELLNEMKIKDDLLVVGHSMAGFNMRVAERLLDNRITGVVLVDPVDIEYTRNCAEDAPGYVNSLVNTIPSKQNSNSSDPTFGNLPYGVITSKIGNAVDAFRMGRLSTNVIHVNATESDHQTILWVEKEAVMVNDVVKQIFDRVLRK
ncbi:hypothetical protein HDV02_003674 [Globomyces sp. JEL0801]|nr:hypothetical protein HDV02_003674 [Globomyces sp. JEL0801]